MTPTITGTRLTLDPKTLTKGILLTPFLSLSRHNLIYIRSLRTYEIVKEKKSRLKPLNPSPLRPLI